MASRHVTEEKLWIYTHSGWTSERAKQVRRTGERDVKWEMGSDFGPHFALWATKVFKLKNLCDDKTCHKNVRNYSMFLQVNVRCSCVKRRWRLTGWGEDDNCCGRMEFVAAANDGRLLCALEGSDDVKKSTHWRVEIYEWAFDLFQPEWTNFVLIQLTNDKAITFACSARRMKQFNFINQPANGGERFKVVPKN